MDTETKFQNNVTIATCIDEEIKTVVALLNHQEEYDIPDIFSKLVGILMERNIPLDETKSRDVIMKDKYSTVHTILNLVYDRLDAKGILDKPKPTGYESPVKIEDNRGLELLNKYLTPNLLKVLNNYCSMTA
ncbi:hypothetical protein TSMG0073 [Halocynthia phage JM-2012]|uniref:hypothetical protein n=1 Tax=Halocynthia phage JM-2012 TaxID=1173297 RepID=UPI00025C691D|nr:hypothetical protein TSMG0073 [Halocynthia phage JM-2012]AFI55356.1 hypothetical protein TSMG0073 [Halocynthia phage JM-2012]